MKSYIKIIILGLLISCSQDEPEFEKVAHELIAIDCVIQEDCEYIIKTENEYFQMVSNSECLDTIHTPFDFNDFILIGKYTECDMNDKISRDVYKYKEKKRIIYKIGLDIVPGPNNNGGFGNIYSFGMNWVKIQKPPEDYEIRIEYSEY